MQPANKQLRCSCRFDLTIAVIFPIAVLLHCISAFSFDRKRLTINEAIFPPSWFERVASVVADPVETEIIRNSLNSLRIFSLMTMATRVGTNIAVCRRFYQLAALITDPSKQFRAVYPKKHSIGAVFVMIAISTVIYAEESIRTSNVACHPHAQCVRYARRWVSLREGDLSQCPCLTIIDVDVALKTYDQWLNPPNVTEKVAQLATSGDLQMIRLINRQLPNFPDELRHCKNMKHLYERRFVLEGARTGLIIYMCAKQVADL